MIHKLRPFVEKGVIRPLDWYFARWLGDKTGNGTEGLLLSAMLASWRLGQGDVCVDLKDYAGREFCVETDEGPLSISFPELSVWLDDLKKSPAVFVDPGVVDEGKVFSEARPLVLCGSRVYIGRYWAYEVALAGALKKLASRESDVELNEVRKVLDKLFGSDADTGPDWQKIAVATAVMRHLTIISGGPGTGKTHTIAATILALCSIYRNSLRIALAAPTGKAAARMMESLRKALRHFGCAEKFEQVIPGEATTLHRLIGMREGLSRARHNPDNPLPANVLIVDEASMVDLPMMYRTVSALKPEARLILLGDRNQLASVEAGSVFADLCGRNQEPQYGESWAKKLEIATGTTVPLRGTGGSVLDDCIVFLKKNYRFSENSSIGRLASIICDGGDVTDVLLDRDGSGDGSVRFRNLKAGEALTADLERVTNEWFEGLFRCSSEDDALKLFEKSRILCAHRDGLWGVSRINRLIEEILTSKGVIKPFLKHYHGRPILITRNNYEVGLFNGDVGIVWRDGRGRLVACFREAGGGIRKVGISRLPEHETAFAMTVHKAQGSECDRILFIMPHEESQILTRELFYTAVTRARSYVEIWGTMKAASEAVSRRTRRASGLYERITNQR
ncbi:exodeoxyribonuclease V subunit alpha [Thermodesulforhabdus norvegica]|uniref:DNA helicase/exodeoxyribonuclease V, alpha subunit n=1 Tax=Thermodesulforhabdus norvegica TaxID=39841 RepID=A0A1I4W9H8_9BACT|nr:exodeoxyribonuclease V subunit alpha [Thermodesulforhabdus norvegica]SFN10318.1 DNA helicase/exodeoxyribonuclease V, alpha subunit [Thermodesulforhabdus norvegica]